MPTTIQDLVRRTWRPPIGVEILPADVDTHYKQWGFTIYRTCYSPESDKHWSLLTHNISTTVLGMLSEYKDQGEEPNAILILSENFKLGARSDLTTLDGLTMVEVCQLYRDEVGGTPIGRTTSLIPDHKIFLLADKEVLQNLDPGVIKVVQAAPNEGADPECYYQWMRLWIIFLVQFWVDLEHSDSGLYDYIWEEQPGALYTG